MEVLNKLNLTADLEHVTDVKMIAAYGIMGSRALLINGKVVFVGKCLAKNKSRPGLIRYNQRRGKKYDNTAKNVNNTDRVLGLIFLLSPSRFAVGERSLPLPHRMPRRNQIKLNPKPPLPIPPFFLQCPLPTKNLQTLNPFTPASFTYSRKP